MKYECSKHPFDVSLITLEIFLLVSLGGGWSWQAELSQPVQQLIHCRLFNSFSKTQFDINFFKLLFIFNVILVYLLFF
jgi:hypothetical protein